MDYNTCLPEGTLVTTDLLDGMDGQVAGIAVNDQPVVGPLYIVKILNRRGAEWKNYPYSCTPVQGSALRIMENVDHVAEYTGKIRFDREWEPNLERNITIIRNLTHHTLRFEFNDSNYHYFVGMHQDKSGLWLGQFDWKHPTKGTGCGPLHYLGLGEDNGKLHITGKWKEGEEYFFTVLAYHYRDRFIPIEGDV